MRNPGRILQLEDNRIVIAYNKQPLISKKKIVLYLVDSDYNLIDDGKGKPKTLIRDLNEYNLDVTEGIIKLIGYVD